MADVNVARAGLARILARFPNETDALRRLVLIDPALGDICEEYDLAQRGLARFAAQPDAAERPEVGDYEAVIAELETEIARILEQIRPRG